MSLKILSWNIWADGYFDQVSDFLEKSDADIIALQEVTNHNPKRDIVKYLDALGYQYAFAPVEKKWDGKIYTDGPAIFSKYKIHKTEVYSLSKTDNRVALRTDVRVKDKAIHVFSTHLIHTHQQESKLQNEQVTNLVKILPRRDTILMGDFNATPDSKVIKKISSIFTDTDNKSLPTWSVYKKGCIKCKPQNIYCKLDYIFVTKDISFNSFAVGHTKASDHLPIFINVKI